MIVVDSSVWISHFANVLHDEVVALRNVPRAFDVMLGDLILLEVLRGARSERHANQIERELRLFHIASMLGEDIAIAAAANYRTLRSYGISIRNSADLIIGTFCIENGHELLQRDRDYLPMARYLGLELYR